MTGYLAHPFVEKGLLLEHGCEKTHNDAMRNFLEEQRLDPERFGWASIQLDGGIEKVTAKVMQWFRDSGDSRAEPVLKEVGLEAMRLAITSAGTVPDSVAEAFALLTRTIVLGGGTVVAVQNASLLASECLSRALRAATSLHPTLAYGQAFTKPGLHVMETPTDHLIETLSGLGATGVEVILSYASDQVLQGHPLVPVAQVGAIQHRDAGPGNPIESVGQADILLDVRMEAPAALAEEMLVLVVRVLSREYRPKSVASGNTDFQMTRGRWGVSL